MRKILLSFAVTISTLCYSQSDFSTILRGGEIILSGLSIYKASKVDAKVTKSDSKLIEVLCIKNKLNVGITFRMSYIDAEDNEIKKELVVPKDGKECLFKVPKGIYTYEIVLPNKEIYRKGEYNFDEDLNMTVKDE